MTQDYWSHIQTLVADSQIVIDRRRETAHPTYPDTIYPLDYGYLAGTMAGDGGGIDVWLGSGDRNIVTGVACTIDLLKRDMEVKILLGCTEDEIQLVENFHNQEDLRCLIYRRDGV